MKKKILVGGIVMLSVISIGGLSIEAYENAFGNTMGVKKYSLNNDINRNDNEVKSDDEKSKDEEFSDNEKEEVIEKTESKEQTVQEGDELYDKLKNAYNNGDIDEALRLYNRISNKEAKEKIDDFEITLETAMKVEERIREVKMAINKKEFYKAGAILVNLKSGYAMNQKQESEVNSLIEEVNLKSAGEGKSEFNLEKATEFYKIAFGGESNDLLVLNKEGILDDGKKYIMVEIRDKTKPNEGTGHFAMIREDGHVSGD